MTEHVRFHFDPLCPWCWQTSRWMRRLVELGRVQVEWGVFSLEVANSPDGAAAVEPTARGAQGLRTAVLVRDTVDNAAMGAFYEALGNRHFHDLQKYDTPDTFHGALRDAGLDPELYDRAMADIGTWHTVIAEHEQLVRETKAFGVPTIRLDGGSGPAIFGPVISQMPTDNDAVQLFEHVAWLARYENFGELKRERLDLDVPSAAAWRARQAAKAAGDS